MNKEVLRLKEEIKKRKKRLNTYGLFCAVPSIPTALSIMFGVKIFLIFLSVFVCMGLIYILFMLQIASMRSKLRDYFLENEFKKMIDEYEEKINVFLITEGLSNNNTSFKLKRSKIAGGAAYSLYVTGEFNSLSRPIIYSGGIMHNPLNKWAVEFFFHVKGQVLLVHFENKFLEPELTVQLRPFLRDNDFELDSSKHVEFLIEDIDQELIYKLVHKICEVAVKD